MASSPSNSETSQITLREESYFAGEVDIRPPEILDRSLWKSLAVNFRDRFLPENLPPLQLTSVPIDTGMLLVDRLSVPWFRTVFTNLGDVVSPEELPPLELESLPIDVGELISDQLSHLWFGSLLRNLADSLVPDRQPPLEVTSKPEHAILPSEIMLLPKWSSVISGPKAPFPRQVSTAPTLSESRMPATAMAPLPRPVEAEIEFLHVMEKDLQRDLFRSRMRARIWTALAAAQVIYLLLSTFWWK